jgi:hypothetical protein
MTPSPIPLRPDPSALRTRAVRSISRATIAAAAHKLDSNRPRQWRDDPDVEFILRAATSPTSLTSAPVLAPVTTQFLASLQPLSAGAQLLDMGIGLSFDGTGSISLPTLSNIYADWVAELAAIPSRAGTSGHTSPRRRKRLPRTCGSGRAIPSWRRTGCQRRPSLPSRPLRS